MQFCKEGLGIGVSFLFALTTAHCDADLRLFFSVFTAECALSVSSFGYLGGISCWIFFEFCNALATTELSNKSYTLRTVSSFTADWALVINGISSIR